ncbi:hypothetical protein B0H19DRAFT_1057111 [Mycena capillaripes]|nr:hypothetical protein B0H19DRAFT_1057111 [Mycena capillaripes]
MPAATLRRPSQLLNRLVLAQHVAWSPTMLLECIQTIHRPGAVKDRRIGGARTTGTSHAWSPPSGTTCSAPPFRSRILWNLAFHRRSRESARSPVREAPCALVYRDRKWCALDPLNSLRQCWYCECERECSPAGVSVSLGSGDSSVREDILVIVMGLVFSRWGPTIEPQSCCRCRIPQRLLALQVAGVSQVQYARCQGIYGARGMGG